MNESFREFKWKYLNPNPTKEEQELYEKKKKQWARESEEARRKEKEFLDGLERCEHKEKCPHYLKVETEAYEVIKRHKEKILKDTRLTMDCVALRLKGLSYPEIVERLIDWGYQPISWQAVQGRVNRYKDKLYS